MLWFIKEAGWGIYPVLLFGLAALAVSIRQVVAPTQARLITAKWLMSLTAIAGVLGAVTGIETSAKYIGEVAADQRWIFLIGLDESLNNVTASLVIVVLCMLALLASHLRHGPEPQGAKARSHADPAPRGDMSARMAAG
jgi:hypothetical protein